MGWNLWEKEIPRLIPGDRASCPSKNPLNYVSSVHLFRELLHVVSDTLSCACYSDTPWADSSSLSWLSLAPATPKATAFVQFLGYSPTAVSQQMMSGSKYAWEGNYSVNQKWRRDISNCPINSKWSIGKLNLGSQSCTEVLNLVLNSDSNALNAPKINDSTLLQRIEWARMTSCSPSKASGRSPLSRQVTHRSNTCKTTRKMTVFRSWLDQGHRRELLINFM